MRASQLFFPTLREVPAEAELVSHRLLLRGGFVRSLAAGVYSYLPLGWRVHKKITRVVREEMDAIGGQEIFMPTLVPEELLKESGRDKVDVLFRLKDRGMRDFIMGFTHEEVVTDIARGDIHSWKQLPLFVYQVQTKFRDEARPRGGLIRVREFTMKDAYSFDATQEGLDKQYDANFRAYQRIFTRCGLDYLAVDADPGAIGGSMNNEFMILAESGEDTVLRCAACGYAANAERADIGGDHAVPAVSGEPAAQVVQTPGAHTVAQVCEFLKVDSKQLIKTIIVTVGGEPVAALVRGDRELNLPKLARFLGLGPAEMADPATIQKVTGAPVGFAGPVGLSGVRIVADFELAGTGDMVVGANAADAHRTGVTPGVDFTPSAWADIRVAVAGDACGQPGCQGHYMDAHGIEVGHIFKLGTKYSHSMRAEVQNETGQNQDILMGCYGLGISRTMAAAIEAHNDDDGIVWPITIAPFEVVVVLVNPKDDGQRAACETLYADLQGRGIDVLFDDRTERSGVKFKDADLIGYPVRVVVGRGLAEGVVEVVLRRDKAETAKVPVAEAGAYVANLVATEKARLQTAADAL